MAATHVKKKDTLKGGHVSANSFSIDERVKVPRDKVKVEGGASGRRDSIQSFDGVDFLFGTVKYVGLVDGKPGDYCGIQLDAKVGRNNGTVAGKVYFACEDAHGIFCRPEHLVKLEPEMVTEATPADTDGDGDGAAGDSDGVIPVMSVKVFENLSRKSIAKEKLHMEKKGPIWSKKVNDMAYRGVRLSNILGFYQRLAEGELHDSAGNILLPHFDPEKHTTNDVVRQAIIPAARQSIFGDVAYATLANNDRPQLATVMVSHHWKNLFCHLIAAMVAFALGKSSYEGVVKDLQGHHFEKLRKALDQRDSLQMTFWGCLFCVNQHISICDSFPPEPAAGSSPETLEWWQRETHDPVNNAVFKACSCPMTKHYNDSEECEMDKFDAMMAVLAEEAPRIALRFHHLIVVDKAFEVFGRIWVMAEIAKGQELEVTQHAMLYGGSAALTAAEVENIRDNLDIRKCSASRKEDVDRILAAIPDIERFNANLRDTLFNKQTGILQTWSAEQVAGFFDMIDPLKDLFQNKAWQAPMVICMGQESTGKSTLMERLTGCPIFPRDADLCTRAILKVRLRRGPATDPKLIVEHFSGKEDLPICVKREDLSVAVLKEMTRQVRLEAKRKQEGPKTTMRQVRIAQKESEIEVDEGPLTGADGVCTTRIVCIELTSPTSPNLDLVDTPGLVAARSRGRPEDVVRTTAELVKKFAQANSEKALFIVTVRASEQPNNSLAMQLVQDLQIESRTLGVLTMTDTITGDLTDGETHIQKSFLKNQGPRLLKMLENVDDTGGNVPLGLGYILTALYDVSENKGWQSYSRIDAMANWEQLFFHHLVSQWQDLEPATDLSLVQSCSTCNSAWRHVKDAVEAFIRKHWLEDTFKLVQMEEASAQAREAELGLPRALRLEHSEMLRLVTAGLPGSLAKATKITHLSNTHEVKELLLQRATEGCDIMSSEMGKIGGMLDKLEATLEEAMSTIPDQVLLGERTSPNQALVSEQDTTSQGRTPPSKVLDDILDQLENDFREVVTMLGGAVIRHLKKSLCEFSSPAKLGRFGDAIKQLMEKAENVLKDVAEGDAPGLGSVKSLRAILGVTPGCGLISTAWVRIERGRGATRPLHAIVDKEQIKLRCLFALNQYADETLRNLTESLRDSCKLLTPEQCAEDISWERYQILAQLQQVRLAQARLKGEDAFAEDVQRLEDANEVAAPEKQELRSRPRRKGDTTMTLGQRRKVVTVAEEIVVAEPEQEIATAPLTTMAAAFIDEKLSDSPASPTRRGRLRTIDPDEDGGVGGASEQKKEESRTSCYASKRRGRADEPSNSPKDSIVTSTSAEGAGEPEDSSTSPKATKQVATGGVGLSRTRRPKTAKRGSDGEAQRRSPEEAEEMVRRWFDNVHKRYKKELSEEKCKEVLMELATYTEVGVEPNGDQCCIWHGATQADGTALVNIRDPRSGSTLTRPANRLVVYLWATDAIYKQLEGSSRGAFKMTCRTLGCICLSHIVVPVANGF